MLDSKNGMVFNNSDKQAAAILEIIEEELNSDLSVGALAKRIDISASHLAHLFKRVTGKPLQRYVRERRIEAAVRLIRATPLRIKQVAAAVGFVNTRYFSRVFRR